ncbi:MAG: sulfurtransferase [Gammaproteobacteria bacterium]|jgi:rhodanese-related sulfurtransferase|nr:sulfurtransferase [Gammaproteobacteria bacterium]|tara:strand:- start:526 stop:1170 length:645 start_codon:yes stop_codon:yes gene_type:complete
MKNILFVLAFTGMTVSGFASEEGKPVGIVKGMMSVEVTHQGKPMNISRNQDNKNTVKPDYAITSRPCPPFCIRPIKLAPGIETIGELEMLRYLTAASKDPSILVIDSRTPDWVKKGTIPGSVNIPWTLLNPETSNPLVIGEILQERFGAIQDEELWDYSDVKTLVMFCNGMWCGQSPRNILTLLKYGYPAEKIKWYRGGMQDWEVLGLTTVSGR